MNIILEIIGLVSALPEIILTSCDRIIVVECRRAPSNQDLLRMQIKATGSLTVIILLSIFFFQVYFITQCIESFHLLFHELLLAKHCCWFFSLCPSYGIYLEKILFLCWPLQFISYLMYYILLVYTPCSLMPNHIIVAKQWQNHVLAMMSVDFFLSCSCCFVVEIDWDVDAHCFSFQMYPSLTLLIYLKKQLNSTTASRILDSCYTNILYYVVKC